MERRVEYYFVYKEGKKILLKPGFKITRAKFPPPRLDSRNAARNPSKISPTVRHEWATTQTWPHIRSTTHVRKEGARLG